MKCKCGYCINEKFVKILYLKDSKKFTSRKLKIGYCRMCNTMVALLSEKRKSDNQIFLDKIFGQKAENIIHREKKNVLVTKYGLTKKYKDDWNYGINKEIKNCKGKVVEIRQYSSDFKGKKELIKKIEITDNGQRIQ